MKKLLYSILTISLLFGCTDMLEQADPTGPTGDDFFITEADVQLAVVAAYAGLTNNNNVWGNNIIGIEQLADAGYPAAGDEPFYYWSNFSYSPTDAAIRNFYQYLYIAINRANLVLQKAPDVEGISPSALNNYLGQAYFLRGYEYFMLTLLFGDVPVILEPPVDPAGYTVAASPASDIYTQIIADLEQAVQLLPETQSDAGRAKKAAATAMLAKVYLFGADELNKSSWYALAEHKAQEVIGSGAFALVNDPAKTPTENLKFIFSLENQNNKEDIFAVQHYATGSWDSYGNISSSYIMAMNPRLNKNLNIWGFGWHHIFEGVATQWDMNDPRRDFSLFIDGESIYVGGVLKGKYSTKTARTMARLDSPGLQKFWWGDSMHPVPGNSDYDTKVFRYADLLLIHAEADLMADGSLSAVGLKSFNDVRTRAGLASMASGNINRRAILDERRWELFGESQRWFDLMRTRTAEQAFAELKARDTNNNDNEKNGFVPEKHYKFPYPQQALDRNPLLVQKPIWASTASK